MGFVAVHAVPLFNTLPLEDFGELNNFNLTLQPNRLFTATNPEDPPKRFPPRTNDFQVLQQTVAAARQVIRINQFYVSQGPTGVGLAIPPFQLADTLAITTPTNEFRMLFGAIESQNLVRTSHLASSQMLTVTYSLPPAGAGPSIPPLPDVTPPQVPQLSILYEGTVPLIRTFGPEISILFIDGVEVNLDHPLPAGRQFTIILDNEQVWFLDVTQSALPVIFAIEENRTVLHSLIPFTGFLRFGDTLTPLPTIGFNEFQRNSVSPFLVTNGPTIDRIIIDGIEIDPAIFNPGFGQPFGPLPAGRSFLLTLSNGDRWLLQTSLLLPPVTFVINRERTTFRSTIFYSGTLIFGRAEPGVEMSAGEMLQTETLSILFTPDDAISDSRTPPQTMLDYNVIGNAYHDIEYNLLTPQITFQGSESLVSLFIDDIEQPLHSPEPFPPGRKFKLVFEFTLPDEVVLRETWLFYIEQSFIAPFPGVELESLGATLLPEPLQLNFAANNPTVLVASGPFTGILRVAVIQTIDPPNISPLDLIPEVSSFWSTTAVTQTDPATPIAMYLLWPIQWTPRLATQLTTFIPANFKVPACALIAELLPTLSLNDFRRAFSYFEQIIPEEYFPTENPFLTYFLMILGRELTGDISAYQTLLRPLPAYGIVPSATLTEARYDEARSRIPIAADIVFETNAYHWNYTCIDDAQNPLILFPGYTRLNTGIHGAPLPGFAYVDAIKGPLLGVHAAGGNVNFLEGPTPPWYALGYIPPFLTFSGRDLSLLQALFAALDVPEVTATTLTATGKQIFEFALTATFAVYLYDQIPRLIPFIQFFTQQYIDVVKVTLNEWLITHVNEAGQRLPDFFVGDSRTPGVVTISGIFAQSQPVVLFEDEGNAIYNLHHRQYGWWLAAAALVMRWDDRFQPNDAWIAQQITLIDGTVFKRKDFLDMLWRDARNPDKNDPDILPFNRHGNPWEGHSTDNGLLYTPLPQGRLQESWAEDFNSWVGTNQYARAVLATPSLDAADKAGFDVLEMFSRTNMELTATSGKLIYQDDSWLYGPPYDVNITVGRVFDTATTAETTLLPGSPSCELYTPP